LSVRRLKHGEDSLHPAVRPGTLQRAQTVPRTASQIALRDRDRSRRADHPRWVFQAARQSRSQGRARLADVHPHLLRHGCGFKLVNQGIDTLSLAAYLGHRQVQNTARYAKMNATRFDGLWRD